PLNIIDALSYLDVVKNHFQNQPVVYNHFLDIMGDFKNQVIDTPGIIQRVSTLFHGNGILIQGFNTFLSVGYRIDISANAAKPHTITLTTPMGMTPLSSSRGEFNHAIQYLNKVKARYSDDLNTYKQFLDVLQIWQQEQNHLQNVCP
ncbi:paired amphipathic helix, partial [Mycena galopus ATCC 62051]